jgi:predicted MPP superfamily phosphohydrolase
MIDPYAWLALLAVPGHMSWLLWLNNNLHARPYDYRRIKPFSKLINSVIAFGSTAAVIWAAVRIASHYGISLGPLAPLDRDLPTWLKPYVALCAVNTIVGFLPWLIRRITFQEADQLLSDEATYADLRTVLAPPLMHTARARFLNKVPGNQALHLAVHTKRLQIPRFPASLAGLRIAHLTDLHLTGELDRRVYEHFADVTQSLQPDIVAFTGDLVEKEPCREYLTEVFARFQAPQGVYFVLGNHDIRIDHHATRRQLTEAGLIDLGTEQRTLKLRDAEILLCGNELPWLGPPPRPPIAARRRPSNTLRLLLSHTPDQYPWAREHDFDLMLAGHVHGGQIRLPWLGPILAPSRYGVHYASGVFYEPPTVLHVGRGTSGKLPLRFFCPPELTLLILEPPPAAAARADA